MMMVVSVSPESAPMELLLLADPSLRHVQSYLSDSTVFIGKEEDVAIAVAVVKRQGKDAEIWNLAVAEHRQRCGLGRLMLEHVVRWAVRGGAERLLVGTGNSSFDAMAFYQKNGFRILEVTRDFFRDYDPPIVENGIPCRDMILFYRRLGVRDVATR